MTLGLVGKIVAMRGMMHRVGRQNRFSMKNQGDYESWGGMYWNQDCTLSSSHLDSDSDKAYPQCDMVVIQMLGHIGPL